MHTQINPSPNVMHSKRLADLLGKGVSLWYPSVKDSINTMRLCMYTSEHLLEGTVVPAMQAVVSMQEQLSEGVVGAVRGDQSYGDLARDTWSRMRSGARFQRLVGKLGKELFGSALLAGETVLVDDGPFRLTYIPAKEGTKPGTPVFHTGGAIPYGDRIFRLLPESCLYERFTERGMPVYAMEMRGDRSEVDYGSVTLDELVDTQERLIDRAFEHAGCKLVLEGYCGHGTQLLPYLAAKPAHAEKTLAAVAIFVAPVHGPACTMIAEVPQLMPERANELQLAIWEKLTGYLWGDGLQLGLDLALKKNFIKTPLGYFHDGWSQAGFSKVKSVADLTPVQRKVLAGAYWISAENARRFPLPTDLVRFANATFTQGVTPAGDLPVSYRGRPLSLADFARETTMPFFGFYGGADPMILDRTAYPLMGILGDRYHHVVHPQAGHISYIFTAELWDESHRLALKPNPAALLLEATKQPKSED